jgi:hypothetical protein
MGQGYAGPGRGVRAIVAAVPVVMPVGMRALFPVLARRLGPRGGHRTGFAAYWAARYLLPLGLLGRDRIRALLRQPARPLPGPRWLGVAALLVPPLGAAATELAPSSAAPTRRCWRPRPARRSSMPPARSCCGVACSWRPSPDDPVWGWLWPAFGFTAWHLAPQAVLPARRG